MKRRANKLCILIAVFSLLGVTACAVPPAHSPATDVPAAGEYVIAFVDDDGREIRLNAPCERIISLYSAHTENLYSLGAGDTVIGVHSTSTYPPAAAFLPQYDYNADPEHVIAADPDCVLVRPFISNRVPDFITALESAGITVVSLYPETFAEFDQYITTLGLLTGTEQAAEESLRAFHARLQGISDQTAAIPREARQRVFFESTETNLRTITPDSMPGLAIQMAGGINLAADAEALSEGGSIAAFGEERILALADEIDVYVSQRGAMNAGGSLQGISERAGFDTVKAVQQGRVYLINEKLISSPTFRYDIGVREMARFLYPEWMDDLTPYQMDRPATRRDLANMLVRAAHLQVYLPSSSSYYQSAHSGHIYGLFEDVTWQDADFDYIEAAVLSGAIEWEAREDGQYFSPEAPVTRDMLARAVFILYDYRSTQSHQAIFDLDDCGNADIVQILVDNGIFDLIDGHFLPGQQMTCAEIAQTLLRCWN